ncbi:pantetheine-phosphate adenylyltransferase [Aequorivita lipolytica]|uniref:Phosphopantetheine adenylyltransferase n=1 Tax=Aequorivita lipolytica TaxID=153267 RepID=A0A5C6YRY9_9FLAO|nr:pantetheine-phosphate adenylyltransferase [Aequorivita lipolytica]TXD69786.1 pantetheine-phosphate adenylyltransferase [Aequorivita lipolytica]SRX50404.1 Phosphopantetheine adenylyltransferase [Aequorivita lipolytica]
MRRAVFPGTFDPITLGHVDIIKRALPLFDELIIAIGVNADKKTMFSLEERISFIEKTFDSEGKIKVKSYTGLTAKFCISEEAQFIVRGLRNTTDLNYEQPIAQTNYKLTQVESIFLICSPEVSNISSTIVRDVMRYDGNYSSLVPSPVTQ